MRNTATTAVTAAAVALVAVAVGGCSNGGGGTAPSRSKTPSGTGPASAPPTATPSAGPVAVHARSGPLGTILVDGQGRTLYLFEADRGRESTCYGDCAKDWPPLVVRGAPTAGSGVREELLGTTARRDGSREVTYHGHPLYYFVQDKRPGDVNGQGSDDQGARWYVLDPAGNRITKPVPSGSPSSSPSGH
ncbi:hypothetical protein ACFVT2_30025 [Streptomyces sp. NPDC058000]|uniref:COG4315 family predicted lipoprotein n=1 Tax=Streptomyces sp. NPDC058000 TaxID=3346299 RepID=UPI0036F0C284